MRSPKIKIQEKGNQILHKPDSMTSKLLEIIEFIVGFNYVAFSRKSLMTKLRMDPFWEGQKIFKSLYNLEKGNFIKRVGGNNYRVTNKGIKRINYSKFFRLALSKKKKDEFLRVVVFDIPEKQKVKRELLRRKLKEFDFQMIQKSVFVSEYVCEKELLELCKILNLRKEVQIILAKNIK